MRALLLAPDSEWARRRAQFEPLHPTQNDIVSSLGFLRLLGHRSAGRVAWKSYDSQPAAFLGCGAREHFETLWKESGTS